MESNGKNLLSWIVVAAALVLGVAVWYYYPLLGGGPALPTGEDAATLQLQTQSPSDDIGAIDQDLNATDLGDLDKELADIEAELAK